MVTSKVLLEIESLLSEIIPDINEIKHANYDLLECISPITLVAVIYVVEKRYKFILSEADLIYENFKTYDAFIKLLAQKVRE